MDKLWLVALGGSIGSCLRYLVSLWSADRFGADFPFGTLLVNIVGCFIIGAFLTAATDKYIFDPNLRFLVVVGFCGGLTTFSSFGYETLKLLEGAGYHYAMLNIAANVVLGLLATWLGMILAKGM